MWRGGEAGITELTSAVSAASPRSASVLLCLLPILSGETGSGDIKSHFYMAIGLGYMCR